ncbi:F16 protein [Hirschfeldia incana]|nr:F16 protein [Hirschfeldia incana]
MYSLSDGTLCSRKRDQMKVNGESFHGSFKRIKHGDQTQAQLEKNTTLFYQRSKLEKAVLIKPDVQLHLETMGYSEAFEDRRTYVDLELNLSLSASSTVKAMMKKEECSKGETLIMSPTNKRKTGDIGLSRSPSWLAFEGDDDNDDQKKQEMVTTVCMKCHMLVMLCKSTLVCPNCKFMHPDDHSSTKTLKPLSLFKLLC